MTLVASVGSQRPAEPRLAAIVAKARARRNDEPPRPCCHEEHEVVTTKGAKITKSSDLLVVNQAAPGGAVRVGLRRSRKTSVRAALVIAATAACLSRRSREMAMLFMTIYLSTKWLSTIVDSDHP
jgi:hypothetical protein